MNFIKLLKKSPPLLGEEGGDLMAVRATYSRSDKRA